MSLDFMLAVERLRPGTNFSNQDGTFAGVRWDEPLPAGFTPPSQEEFEAQVAELSRLEYQGRRRVEYPPVGDQLDALWKGGEAAAAMKALVEAVKLKHPKPSGA